MHDFVLTDMVSYHKDQYKPWNLKGGLWLQEFLGSHLNRCRILLFHYQMNVHGDPAKDLVAQLIHLRRRHANRPIIFIAHGIGCLIVKQVGILSLL